MCGKASFLHHDYQHYSNFRCGDKKCYHSFFVMKPAAVAPASFTALFGKTDFSRMRYPVHIIIATLVMFFIGNNSFRQIALMMRILHNVSISHTTVSNWCTRFAPLFQTLTLSSFLPLTSVLMSGTLMKLWSRFKAESTIFGSL
jgi:hypothetical protein